MWTPAEKKTCGGKVAWPLSKTKMNRKLKGKLKKTIISFEHGGRGENKPSMTVGGGKFCPKKRKQGLGAV